jgi:hypothetical protein
MDVLTATTAEFSGMTINSRTFFWQYVPEQPSGTYLKEQISKKKQK